MCQNLVEVFLPPGNDFAKSLSLKENDGLEVGHFENSEKGHNQVSFVAKGQEYFFHTDRAVGLFKQSSNLLNHLGKSEFVAFHFIENQEFGSFQNFLEGRD